LPERQGTSEGQKLAAKLTKQKLQLSSGSSIYYGHLKAGEFANAEDGRLVERVIHGY